ncbi:hypothetical protein [Halorussus pelagicus]|uniref:hypothetical protein n=1 Tax=Halorussus pelagicus TaxID=2505977 RepID=UPI000FFB0FA5|nr:hypothetical protein [Halorussus pelagicus]
MSESDDSSNKSPSIAVLENVTEESEKSLEYQLETLADIDDKAIRVYRANILFLSIVIGVVSIAVKNEPTSVAHLINMNSVAGVLLLLGSLSTGAITYRASDMQAGIGPEEIKQVLRDEHDEWKSRCLVLSKYQQYLDKNDDVLQTNAKWITYTTVLTIDAFAYVALGVFVASTVDASTPSIFAVVVAVLGFPVVVWISKILSFDSYSGGKYLLGSIVVVFPFLFAYVLFDVPMLGCGWVNVSLYFLTLSLLQRKTNWLSPRSYFLTLVVVSVLTVILVAPPELIPFVAAPAETVLTGVFPQRLDPLLTLVHPLDFALFVIAGGVLVTIDYWIY